MSLQSRSDSVASTYVEQEILSESPLARVARVYEMARVALARARSGLAREDRRLKAIGIDRATRCISLLQSSLNVERGGEVASNLDRLYSYMLRRISEGHMKDDDGVLAEVAGYVEELGIVWREAAGGEMTRTADVGQLPEATAAP